HATSECLDALTKSPLDFPNREKQSTIAAALRELPRARRKKTTELRQRRERRLRQCADVNRTDRGTTATCDAARTPRLAKGVEVNDVHGAPSRSRQGLPGRNVGKLAGANKSVEAPPGFEPGVEVLQTSALPLGDGAPLTVRVHLRPTGSGGQPSREGWLASRSSLASQASEGWSGK